MTEKKVDMGKLLTPVFQKLQNVGEKHILISIGILKEQNIENPFGVVYHSMNIVDTDGDKKQLMIDELLDEADVDKEVYSVGEDVLKAFSEGAAYGQYSVITALKNNPNLLDEETNANENEATKHKLDLGD
jgi:hypothetical protein